MRTSLFPHNSLVILVRDINVLNVFRMIPNPFNRFLQNLNFFYLLNFVLMIPSAKHNSTMDKATGLISLLFDVTSA